MALDPTPSSLAIGWLGTSCVLMALCLLRAISWASLLHARHQWFCIPLTLAIIVNITAAVASLLGKPLFAGIPILVAISPFILVYLWLHALALLLRHRAA